MSKKREQNADVTTFRGFRISKREEDENVTCMERDPEPGPEAGTGVRAMQAPPSV